MTNEQKEVRAWMQAFGQECPEKPCVPSLEVRKLRAKLILEEALETIFGLGFHVKIEPPREGPVRWLCSEEDFKYLEFWNGKSPNLQEIADGCEDLKVVTEGTLVACGLTTESKVYIDENGNDFFEEVDPLFNEVMRSNWTKLWTGKEINQIFGEDGENVEPHCIVGKDHYHDDEHEIKRVIYTEGQDRCWLVKDKDGKVIKSPSYSPPNLEQFINQ